MGLSDIPTDRKLDPKVIEAHLEDTKRQREMGKIGVLFGSKENASIYIAFILAFILLFLIGIELLVNQTSADRIQIIQILASILLGVIGFIFGAKSSGGKDH